MGRTEKILISCEEKQVKLIQRVHERAQHPAMQQSLREGAAGIPELCGGPENERHKACDCSWQVIDIAVKGETKGSRNALMVGLERKPRLCTAGKDATTAYSAALAPVDGKAPAPWR